MPIGSDYGGRSASEGRAPGEQRIFDAFLETAETKPDATALVHDKKELSYRELEASSRALGCALGALLGSSRRVAIVGKRSPELVIAMLGCLRAGCPFAVLDSGVPGLRLQEFLAPVAPELVLFTEPPSQAHSTLARELGAQHRQVEDLVQTAPSEAAELDGAHASDTAYFMFTSGTTGTPKCVVTSHAPLVHFVAWYAEEIGVPSGSRFSMLSGLGHDPLNRDIFVPLSTGAEIRIPPSETVLAAQALFAWMQGERITHVHCTPQHLSLLLQGAPDGVRLDALAVVGSGGDALLREQALRVQKLAPKAQLVNFYGATETPQAMGFHVFSPSEEHERVPVGRGIRDVELLVLDEALEPCPVGQLGQIAVRTRYLSEGYLDDPELTARRFKVLPDPDTSGERVYLTGDLGTCSPDGVITLQGRNDDQVKVRGYRVELADVALHIREFDEANDCVVLPERTSLGENRLVAYVVGAHVGADRLGPTRKLREFLGERVPAYMVPSEVVWLSEFPLLENGKVDRQKLRALPRAPAQGRLTTLENEIAELWRGILGVQAVDSDQSFVDLGGDSLSFVHTSARLERILGWLPERWELIPLARLAELKREDARGGTMTVAATIIVRAVTIALIVAGHLGLVGTRGEADALFILSGFSLAKYQLPQVFKHGRVQPLLSTAWKIAVPTVLFILMLQVKNGQFKWQSLALVSNFYEYLFDDFRSYWFVEVLLQIYVALCLQLAFERVRRVFRQNPYGVALGACAVFLGVRLLAPMVWPAPHLAGALPHLKLWLVLLGIAAGFAESRKQRVTLLVLTLLALAAGHDGDAGLRLIPTVAMILALFELRAKLPVFLGRPITAVASASLFIYVTHLQVHGLFHRLGIPNAYVILAAALLIGWVGWFAWEQLLARALRQRAASSSVGTQRA